MGNKIETVSTMAIVIHTINQENFEQTIKIVPFEKEEDEKEAMEKAKNYLKNLDFVPCDVWMEKSFNSFGVKSIITV